MQHFASVKTLKRLFRVFVTLLVVLGLVYASYKAVGQWRAESNRAAMEIAELDELLSRTDDADQRDLIIEKREQLIANQPLLRNVDYRYLFLAAVSYAIGLIPSALLLCQAIGSFGEKPPSSITIAAHLLGHVGKYVPGKALVVILRAGVLRSAGVPTLKATVSIFIETLMMMAVGGTISSLIVILLPVPGWIIGLAILASIVASLPTLPPVMSRITKYLFQKKNGLAESSSATGDGNSEESAEAAGYRNVQQNVWRLFFIGWFLSIVTWCLIGFSFSCVIMAIPTGEILPPPLMLFAIATAAISLAVVLGFASLIPGGAGVRELVLASILGIMITPTHGLLAAVLIRGIHIFTEAVIAVGCWIWLRGNKIGPQG